MKHTAMLSLILSMAFSSMAQSDQRLIVVTSDGVRWQDVFKGMDPAIASDKRFNQGDSAGLFERFGGSTAEERRKRLMPFTWGTMAAQGRIHGNRAFGNNVDVANPHWFSYPGYSELMTGQVDSTINTNDYPPNPYVNLLEFFNRMPNYRGKVAAFAAWDAFDRILNEKRAGFPVINGFDDNASASKSTEMKLINEMLQDSYRPWGSVECQDVFTHHSAFTHLRQAKPKVLYIAYGDTDEFAHHAQYKFYIEAIRQFDKYLSDLWNWVQSQPDYKDKTTLLVTTDHGRGDLDKSQWTDHGRSVPDASQTWFMVIGPKVKPGGEIRTPGSYQTLQFAQTAARLMGLEFKPGHSVGRVIEEVVR